MGEENYKHGCKYPRQNMIKLHSNTEKDKHHGQLGLFQECLMSDIRDSN